MPRHCNLLLSDHLVRYIIWIYYVFDIFMFLISPKCSRNIWVPKIISSCLQNGHVGVVSQLSRSWFLQLLKEGIELKDFFFFFFWPCSTACGILVPNQGSNPCPLQWKPRVLTTGPTGKSLNSKIFIISYNLKCLWFLCELQLFPFLKTRTDLLFLDSSLFDLAFRLGVWDRHVHTAIFKIDNQQGPTV